MNNPAGTVSAPPTATRPDAEQRLRLSLVPWEKYAQLVAWFDGRHVRLTYDRGELELMTVSHQHEFAKHLLGVFLLVLLEELGIEFHGGGSMTFNNEDLERGLEPDECYWIAHEAEMRHVEAYDSEVHPPPDLVLEVEVSRSVMDRLGIYAAMRVPEVWRWTGERLIYCRLSRGRYHQSEVSTSFPMLAAAEIERFVALRPTMSELALLREFRAWVREQQNLNWPTTPTRTRKKGRG